MSAKHTPGPWHIGGIFDPDSDHPTVNIWGPAAPGAQSGEVVAQKVALKNAPLLESVPDLLEVLDEALRQTGCDGDLCMWAWHEKARVALAKARGES